MNAETALKQNGLAITDRSGMVSCLVKGPELETWHGLSVWAGQELPGIMAASYLASAQTLLARTAADELLVFAPSLDEVSLAASARDVRVYFQVCTWCLLELSGPVVREVFAQTCAVDVDRLMPGALCPTRLAQVNVWLWSRPTKPDAAGDRTWWLWADVAVADHLAATLEEVTRG